MIVRDDVLQERPISLPNTIANALKYAASQFKSAGIEKYHLDARLLMQKVTGLEHAALISAGGQKLNEPQQQQYDEFINRRVLREPVHRIIGEKEFWGMKLEISNAVLDPRADTECLVEAVLSQLEQHNRKNDALRIVDIGTGSGAIILALMRELPNAEAVATDISGDALKIAENNAKKHGFNDRISFFQGSYFEPLSGQFDLIVSNPPYIASSDILALEPEVQNHDPDIALDGGVDGLDAYRCLLGESAGWLGRSGMVFFEIGFDQASTVTALAINLGWQNMEIVKDYGGNDRVFTASL